MNKENGDQPTNKVLVTGANGFIGRAVCRELGHRGYHIRKLDRMMLSQFKVLTEFMEQFQPDYIIHLASYGNMGNQTEVNEIIYTNIHKTWNLLASSVSIPYKALINVSTSSIYGQSTSVMSEDLKPRPDTFYAATKMCAEHLCRAVRKQYKKNIVTVRPFSVYGPGEADYRFIPTILRNKAQGIASNVIRGMHDWIYITDFVDGLLFLMESTNLKHREFNIGTGIQTSNEQVADMLHVPYILKPEWKPQDSKRWQADISRITDSGWKPQVTLKQGLKLTNEYYQKKYEKY